MLRLYIRYILQYTYVDGVELKKNWMLHQLHSKKRLKYTEYNVNGRISLLVSFGRT